MTGSISLQSWLEDIILCFSPPQKLSSSPNSEIQNSTRNLPPLVPGVHIIQLKTLARLQHNSLLSWPAFILIAKMKFFKFILVSGTELCVLWWDYFTGWTATCGWKVANRTYTWQRLRFPKETDSGRQYTTRQTCHGPMGLDKCLQKHKSPKQYNWPRLPPD